MENQDCSTPVGLQNINSELLLQALENFPNACYLCDVQTYELLYCNRAASTYGNPAAQKCYQYLQHSNTPCQFCPLKNRSGDEIQDCKFTLPDSRTYLHMKGTLISWKNRTLFIASLTDETAANTMLMDTLRSARHAEAAKAQFLSRMSHELRTPLNAIIGLSLLAAQDAGLEEMPALNITSIKDSLAKIQLSARELLSLINDILELSSLEKESATLSESFFSLEELVHCAMDTLSQTAASKQITCSTKLNLPPAEEYLGDSKRILQVLISVLENAVKFTHPGGHVTLSVTELQRTDTHALLCFTIHDTGIGMNTDFIPFLFDSFSQEDDAYVTTTSGIGLGLSISKKLITMMNGTIDAKSTKDKGSEFTIKLPLGLPAHAGISRIKNDSSRTSRSRTPKSLLGKKVLLAEDQPLNVEVAKRLLEKEGIDVTVAQNGLEALHIFTQYGPHYFDGILMDIRMPVMDGLSATREIRKLTAIGGEEIPIIAITANAFDRDKKQSLSHGMNAHLTKPIDPEALYETLQQWI